jgi:hypothetical protein
MEEELVVMGQGVVGKGGGGVGIKEGVGGSGSPLKSGKAAVVVSSGNTCGTKRGSEGRGGPAWSGVIRRGHARSCEVSGGRTITQRETSVAHSGVGCTERRAVRVSRRT